MSKKPKAKPELEQKLDLIRITEDNHSEMMEFLKKHTSQFIDHIHRKSRDEMKFLSEISKVLASHKKILEQISLVNETVEDTLLNVLLAIRQNEYLQAWYPAQNGQPEMKVVGSHPNSAMAQKIENRRREKNE